MATYMYSSERRTGPGRKNGRGQPAWDLALLYPPQGMWTEAAYLALENNSENHMVELVDGFLEVLPMPDLAHQRIVRFVFMRLDAHVAELRLGEVMFAPLPVRLWDLHVREPDIVYLRKSRIKNPHEPPDGADLVMEVVSSGKENRQRDLKEKRTDYAKAKIREYWIIDPDDRTITVLALGARRYKVHGKFKDGDVATSLLLRGFQLDVSEVLGAADRPIN